VASTFAGVRVVDAGSSAPPDRGRIPALDGLRALACLAVFGVHWQQFTGFRAEWGPFSARRFLENGNTGVALLFILSGALISLPFWSRPSEATRSSIREYVLLRTTRILPAYYVSLIAVAMFSGHIGGGRHLRDLLLHLTFLHNMLEDSFYSLSPPFWTIAVQAQSYVLMPLLMVLVTSMTSRHTVRLALLAVMAGTAYGVHWLLLSRPPVEAVAHWVAAQPTVAAHTLLAHTPHFVLGLVAGAFFRSAKIGSRFGSSPNGRVWMDVSVFLLAAFVVVTLAAPVVDDWFSVPFGRYNLPWVPLALAWVVAAAPRGHVSRILLELAPLRLLGVISYGVYVYHYPAMQAVGRIQEALAGGPAASPWIFAWQL
jgi:peptidoglycan/LPS O-acetylase OafA/YrhL